MKVTFRLAHDSSYLNRACMALPFPMQRTLLRLIEMIGAGFKKSGYIGCVEWCLKCRDISGVG